MQPVDASGDYSPQALFLVRFMGLREDKKTTEVLRESSRSSLET
jgi:hypothetical protein